MTVKAPRLRDRIRSLRARLTELNSRIREEMTRPMPDGSRVQMLKRMRLKAKDQIAFVMRQLRTKNGPQQPSAA